VGLGKQLMSYPSSIMQMNLLTGCGPSAAGSATALMTEPLSADADNAEPPAARITSIVAENAELKAEIEQLRAERTRAIDSQRAIMQLLGTTKPEKITHDIRNLLNERDLLKTLVDQM
jgi:hypothetical protein